MQTVTCLFLALVALGAASSSDVGPVQHIVAFNFQPNVTDAMVQKIVQRYLALKDLCIDPATGQTYITSFIGGTPNSKEGFQQGMRVVFVMELPNLAFRDYFVGRPFTTPYDPEHDAFKAFVGPYLLTPIEKGLIVLDFVGGAFDNQAAATLAKTGQVSTK